MSTLFTRYSERGSRKAQPTDYVRRVKLGHAVHQAGVGPIDDPAAFGFIKGLDYEGLEFVIRALYPARRPKERVERDEGHAEDARELVA